MTRPAGSLVFRLLSFVLLPLSFLLPLSSTGCREAPEPIAVDTDRITVFNRTEVDWQDLEVRVNGYYVVPVASLARRGRFDVPITRLQGGFGHYFDPKRERVQTVVVTGTTRRGEAVTLKWAED